MDNFVKMTAIFDMTRRFTLRDTDEPILKQKLDNAWNESSIEGTEGHVSACIFVSSLFHVWLTLSPFIV